MRPGCAGAYARTVVVNDDDWRLAGQESYLQGVTLELKAYRRWSESWDHDHCEFCWVKLVEPADAADEPGEVLSEGYATTAEHPDGAEYHWICTQCFDDFAERFEWSTLTDGSSG